LLGQCILGKTSPLLIIQFLFTKLVFKNATKSYTNPYKKIADEKLENASNTLQTLSVIYSLYVKITKLGILILKIMIENGIEN